MICACQELRFIPLQSPRGGYNIEGQQFSIRQPDLLMFRSRNLINLKKMLFSKSKRMGCYKISNQAIQRFSKVDNKSSLLQVTQFTENWYACLLFFASTCRELLVTFAKLFDGGLQNGFNSCKSSQMKQKTRNSMN